ncbi:MAG: 23S rRNA (adenine(2030)-N(6))-methyltransferase RlmJ [Caulobacterales bacterium]|nr:23S rRNA (adenine(2030)-N(6))-methyltransferase RlmJ [Caulobacterales bacterium]
MNYRHSFHAGNFADLHKHAVLLLLLKAMKPQRQAFTVIDTHAGAGIYDLASEDQTRSKEAERGIQALMAGELPGSFEPLIEAVRGVNSWRDAVQLYPGSPWLIVTAMDADDTYIGCEVQPQVREQLELAMGMTPTETHVRDADGYEVVGEESAGLILIDPPYERRDDYERAAQAAALAQSLNPDVVVAIWTPLKDLETLDGFLRDLKKRTGAEILVSEARMRPLSDPMKMNGSAMVIVRPPQRIDGEVAAVAEALVDTLGEPDGEARLWRL